jgi:HD-like signal output (HDOD) protein/CheY-like chemotaxis protein
MTQTILFVDEEKFVHKALKRSFRKMRQEWDMRFATGPAEALEILNKETIEVIVTETMFQAQSGLDFLKVVREGHPNSVRIILSGYSDQNVILKSVDLAHQYLTKPCEDDALKATISRAFIMKELLDHHALKEIVSQIDSLPTLPAIYVELVEELKSDDASIETIGAIISKDIGLTAKILKMVNSSFFGLRQQITNPTKAVSMLGLDLVKAIVLTSGSFNKFKNLKYPGFSLEQMWNHAMLTGAFAKVIAKESGLNHKVADTAFMAGLLHDIGKLLIASHLPDSFKMINKLIEKIPMPMFEAETRVIGTTHSCVGAYLLGLWGLPDAILDATAFHHCPWKKPSADLNSTTIIHIADALAQCGEDIHQSEGIVAGLDYEYLEKSGHLESVRQWKTACSDYVIDDGGQ